MEVEQVLESAPGEKRRFNPLLHGRGVEEPQRSRYAVSGADGERREGAGAGSLYDARHAEPTARRSASREPGWITTTTTSTPRRNFTATSSPPAPIRSVWIRWIKCVMPGSKSVPAASSA
jgi:hypothetical protein